MKAGFGSRQTCLIVPCCTATDIFSKEGVACVDREIQSAALEIWRSHAIFQAPLPLSTGSCSAGTSANFIFLKCGFPLPFVCLVVVVVVVVFYCFL